MNILFSLYVCPTYAADIKTDSKVQVSEGRIAYVDINKQYIIADLGSDNGLTVGQTLYVFKVVKDIYKMVNNKETDEIIKKVTKLIGELKVTELDNKVTKCLCVSGDCDKIKEGDKVSTVMPA